MKESTFSSPKTYKYKGFVMELVSYLHDNRINSDNILTEMSISEYVALAEDIKHKNEFQRKKIRSSKSVYGLLKKDLQRGCMIPPIVLALTSEPERASLDSTNFREVLEKEKEHLVILDGLQRTNTILELVVELREKGDNEALNALLSHKIRVEIYIGINRIGILYRMLTLNTGQTPMSLRQQIEILYYDYSDTQVEEVELIKESDERRASGQNQFNFRDILDGYNSYLDRNELPIDRTDVLENIRSLEYLANENEDYDLFAGYLRAWRDFFGKIVEISNSIEVSRGFREEFGNPFGKNAQQVFKKPQAMAGFGAAIGRLKDFDLIEGFETISEISSWIEIGSPEDFIDDINQSLDWIKNNTKKIGNAQRSYFQYYFRDLFNPQSDAYLVADEAIQTSLQKYKSQNI